MEPGSSAPPGTAPSGVYAVLYAFFRSDGSLDREAMRSQLEGCVADRVHGIMIPGLATEVRKLSPRERRDLMDWVAEDLDGRLPLSITIFEHSVEDQIAAAHYAAGVGADWIILQPPPEPDLGQADLMRFFGRVAESVACPVGIQNAPQWLGVGLEPDSIASLCRDCPNITVMKAECSALEFEVLHRTTDGRLSLFNGRGGLEFIDVVRAGGAGAIVASETAGMLARVYELATSSGTGERAQAESLYRDLLPLIVFQMQSLDTLLCYGKRLAAHRFGIAPVHDRPPILITPTAFGLETLRRHAKILDEFRSC